VAGTLHNTQKGPLKSTAHSSAHTLFLSMLFTDRIQQRYRTGMQTGWHGMQIDRGVRFLV
jgi:hypothetical protein